MAPDMASPVLCRSAELTWRMISRRYVSCAQLTGTKCSHGE